MSEGMGTTAPATIASNPAATPTAAQKTAPADKAVVPNFTGTKHKVKIDGQEIDVDYDELKSGYQSNRAAQQRFQQAAEKEKQSQAFIAAVETGDYKPFEQKYGKQKLKEWMENYLIGDLEEEDLKKNNPSEYRARQLEQQLKEKERAEQELKAKEEQSKKDQALKRAAEEIDTEVNEALKSLGKKPTPRMAARIVDEMLIRLEGKNQKISGSEASKYAFKAIEADISEYLPTLSEEQLLSVIPREVIDRIRQHEVNQVVTQRSAKRVKAPDSSGSKQQKPKNIDSWFETREKQLKRRG